MDGWDAKVVVINAVQVEVDNGLGKIGYFKGVLPRCIGCVGWVGGVSKRTPVIRNGRRTPDRSR